MHQIDCSNVPVIDSSDPMMLTSLAIDEQRARGFDAELTWQPNKHWKLMANYAYVAAPLTEDIPGGAPAGSCIDAISRRSGGLSVDPLSRRERSERLERQRQSARCLRHATRVRKSYETKSYFKSDARIHYKGVISFSANLIVKNLIDEQHYTPYPTLSGANQPLSRTGQAVSSCGAKLKRPLNDYLPIKSDIIPIFGDSPAAKFKYSIADVLHSRRMIYSCLRSGAMRDGTL